MITSNVEALKIEGLSVLSFKFEHKKFESDEEIPIFQVE